MKALLLSILFSLGVVFAQTQWEFARLSTIRIVGAEEDFTHYRFIDNSRRGLFSNNHETFALQLGITGEDFWDVLEFIGKEGYELVNYERERYETSDGSEVIDQTWYFKRPL
jgi:hypothetical protein